MYAVKPLTDCDHLQQVGPLPEKGLDVNDPCTDCGNTEENWVCLICYKVRGNSIKMNYSYVLKYWDT